VFYEGYEGEIRCVRDKEKRYMVLCPYRVRMWRKEGEENAIIKSEVVLE